MGEGLKAKEPWVTLFLNAIFPGLGQIYAKRTIRGIVIIGVAFLLLCIAFIGVLFLVNPDVVLTKTFVISGIVVIILVIAFTIFTLIDGWICVRKYNISNNVKHANMTFRIVAIVACLILFFTPTTHTPIAAYIRNSVIQAFKIPSHGMAPTLQIGDRIFVNKRAYLTVMPQRGDIIVFKNPQDMKKSFLKRVVGLPGETLEIKDGKVIINGNAVESKFHYYNAGDYGKESEKIEIPLNNYYVLGDDSESSRDSRHFGFIPSKYIIGKATKIYWPLERSGKIE